VLLECNGGIVWLVVCHVGACGVEEVLDIVLFEEGFFFVVEPVTDVFGVLGGFGVGAVVDAVG